MTLEEISHQDFDDFQQRMGRVYHQPVSVSSYTNKRFTVNYRAPVEQLQEMIPDPIEVEEIRDTGQGMISYCVCDFNVSRLGPFPIKTTHNNEMLLRISVLIPKDDKMKRAYYTIRSDASSKLLGLLGGRFSHFRKAISEVEKIDDGEIYQLENHANNSLCSGYFRGELASNTKQKPETTVFADINEATDFVFEVDGSCGYSFKSKRLSFGEIEYPEWDIYFCHKFDYKFNLLDYLTNNFGLEMEFDSVLFMEKVDAVWKPSKLYKL